MASSYNPYMGNQFYMQDLQNMREQSRKLEDIADMAENSQDKSAIMKVAQKEKEHYEYLKQMMK